MDHFLQSSSNLLQNCFCFRVFDHEACGASAPHPGIEPTPPVLKAQVSTTRQPGGLQTCLKRLSACWPQTSSYSLSRELGGGPAPACTSSDHAPHRTSIRAAGPGTSIRAGSLGSALDAGRFKTRLSRHRFPSARFVFPTDALCEDSSHSPSSCCAEHLVAV